MAKILVKYRAYPGNPRATELSKQKEVKKGRIGAAVGFVLFIASLTLAGGVVLPLGNGPMITFLLFALALTILVPVMLEVRRSDRYERMIDDALGTPAANRANESFPKVRNISLIILGALLAVFIGVTAATALGSSNDYQQAKALMAAGDYAAAQEAFEAMGDYKDAKEQAKEAQYQRAAQALAEGDYATAVKLTKDEKKYGRFGNLYNQAVNLWNAERDEAMDAAAALAAEGRFEEAAAAYAALNGYTNSQTKAKECYYQAASLRAEAGEYAQAAELYAKSKDYQDAEARRVEALMALADEYRAQGDFERAAAVYDQLKDHEQAAELARAMRYLRAAELLQGGDADAAYAMYSQILDYRDVMDILQQNESLQQAGLTAVSQPGSKVFFGHWEQDADEANGAEPICWTVVEVKDGMALLFADALLDLRPYTEETQDTYAWDSSVLRTWLNGEFYDTAFSGEEKARIADKEGKNNSKSITYTDRVFLLYPSNYEKLEKDGVFSFKAALTPWALQKAEGIEAEKLNQWWHHIGSGRSIGVTSPTGSIHYGSSDGTLLKGVRPAIYYSLGE